MSPGVALSSKGKSGLLAQVARKVIGKKSSAPVILASEYDYASTVYSHAAVLPCLAGLMQAEPKSFSFVSDHRSALTKVYKSIGAPRALDHRDSRKYERGADAWARRAVTGLRSRQELLDLELDGFPLGMVIYDTVMRTHGLPTVDLQDQRLFKAAKEAAMILRATSEYFDRREVRAVFPDHLVYNYAGILAQFAWQRGVPVMVYSFSERFYLYRIPPMRREKPGLEVPYQHAFDRYPEDFAALDKPEARLQKARLAIGDHLTGGKTDLIFGGHSAYGNAGATQRLGAAKRPRVLIMLHDFCDAPHVYGKFLFPDFVEWMDYLLPRAKKTGFEWLIKPHPNLQDHSRARLVKTNQAMVDQLRRKHPWLTFVDPEYSNHQLIEDGVKALFTVRGSAGHEFAYLGVPVVNAGPNPHMRYDFNFHPRTLAEYDTFIAKADSLKVGGSKRDIEEFYYMRYFSMHDRFAAEATPLPPVPRSDLAGRPTLEAIKKWQDGYGRAISPEIRSYVEDVYHSQICKSP